MLYRLAVSLILALPSLAQAPDDGAWELPFNHVVPAAWKLLEPGWDGEHHSPYSNYLDPHRFMAAHLALIPCGPHRGELLVMNWMRKHHVHGKQYWSIVDVQATPPSFQNFALPMPEENIELFCAGHAWSAAGELLVVGGDRFEGERLRANRLAYRFDPTATTGNAMWSREQDMVLERWYPTVTTMGTDASGHDLMLVSGGIDFDGAAAHRTYEAFDPAGAPGHGRWQVNLAAGDTRLFDGPDVACVDAFGIYPRDFVLTDGTKFSAGMASLGYRVQHTPFGQASAPSWEVQPDARPLCRWYGTSFVHPNPFGAPNADLIFRVGGAMVTWGDDCIQSSLRRPTDSVEACFAAAPVGSPDWNWRTAPALQYPRNNPNSVVLPDGTVLVLGGRLDELGMLKTGSPVLHPELLTGPPFSWRTLTPSKTRRGYHSTAALLPDGRVITAGGEQREKDYEIFRPPYLTDGSSRPVLVSAPETLVATYGAERLLRFDNLPAGVALDRVSLLAPASVTHHTDVQQRYVDLELLAVNSTPTGSTVHFRMPPNSQHAPRGYYMLFLVTAPQGATSNGTPSQALWVKLE